MSINTEITRIDGAKSSIKTAIEGKGVTVPSATKIDGMATYISQIPTGGGKGGDYNIVQTIDGDNCSLAITDANTFVLTTKTVTQNGTYNASADNADGYSQVTVAIPTYDGTVV